MKFMQCGTLDAYKSAEQRSGNFCLTQLNVGSLYLRLVSELSIHSIQPLRALNYYCNI